MRPHFISIFITIFLKSKLILHVLLNQMYGYCLVPLILYLFRILVTSFRFSCSPSNTFYLSIMDIQASCACMLHFLSNTWGMLIRMIIRNYHSLLLPLYVFIISVSCSPSSSVVTYHSFIQYFVILLCLAIALVFSFHLSNLS